MARSLPPLLLLLLRCAPALCLLTKVPPRPRSVTSSHDLSSLLADGVPYSSLDIRGDSSALLKRGGGQQHPVAAALHQRRESSSRPGERTDGHRIALAIEGGGMRGCVAAGMVAAIHELGLTDGFDAVYGSSAGSLIGAYLLSRQVPRYGCSIYYENLPGAGRAFIDLRNVLRSVGMGWVRLSPTGIKDMMRRRLGMPVLNLDHLLVDIVQRIKPLDWQAFWKAQPTQPLRVVASNLQTETATVFGSDESDFTSLPELAQCMRASMLLPGICGPVVQIPSREGDAYADAMLYEPIPYRSATSEGASHVLVLRTRPDGVNLVKKQSVSSEGVARPMGQDVRAIVPHSLPIPKNTFSINPRVPQPTRRTPLP